MEILFSMEYFPKTGTYGIPWTKAELQAIVKGFPKVIEDSHRFAEKFNTVTQTYSLGFSDL